MRQCKRLFPLCRKRSWLRCAENNAMLVASIKYILKQHIVDLLEDTFNLVAKYLLIKVANAF